MERIRNVLCLIIAVVLIISCFSTVVLAADPTVATEGLLIDENYNQGETGYWTLINSGRGTLKNSNGAISLTPTDGSGQTTVNVATRPLNNGAGYPFTSNRVFVIETRLKQTDASKGLCFKINSDKSSQTYIYDGGFSLFKIIDNKIMPGSTVGSSNWGEFSSLNNITTLKTTDWLDVRIELKGDPTGQTQAYGMAYFTDTDGKTASMPFKHAYLPGISALKSIDIHTPILDNTNEILLDYLKLSVAEDRIGVTVGAIPSVIETDGIFEIPVTFSNGSTNTTAIKNFFSVEKGGNTVAANITAGTGKVSVEILNVAEGDEFKLVIDEDGLSDAGYRLTNVVAEYSITALHALLYENYNNGVLGGWKLLNAGKGTLVCKDQGSGDYAISLTPTDGSGQLTVNVATRPLNNGTGYAFEEGKMFVIETRLKQADTSKGLCFKINSDKTSKTYIYDGGFSLFKILNNKIMPGDSVSSNWGTFSSANNITTLDTSDWLDVKIELKGDPTGQTQAYGTAYFSDVNGNTASMPFKHAYLPGISALKSIDIHTPILDNSNELLLDFLKVSVRSDNISQPTTNANLEFDGEKISKVSPMYIWGRNTVLDDVVNYVKLYDKNNSLVSAKTELEDERIKITSKELIDGESYTLKVDKSVGALNNYVFNQDSMSVKVYADTEITRDFSDGEDGGFTLSTLGASDTDVTQEIVEEDGNKFLRLSLTRQTISEHGVSTTLNLGQNGFIFANNYTVYEAKIRTNGHNFIKNFTINENYTGGNSLWDTEFSQLWSIRNASDADDVKNDFGTSFERLGEKEDTSLQEHKLGKFTGVKDDINANEWYTVKIVFDNINRTMSTYLINEAGKTVGKAEYKSMEDKFIRDLSVVGPANYFNYKDLNCEDRETLRYINTLSLSIGGTSSQETENIDIDDLRLYNVDNIDLTEIEDKFKITFTNEQGRVADELRAGESYTLKVDISTASSGSEKVVLHSVLYKDNVVEDVISKEIDKKDGTYTLPELISVPNEDGYKVKVFIWESYSSLRPLCTAVEEQAFKRDIYKLYVDPETGNDTALGTSVDAPLKTISKAQEKLKSAIRNNQIVDGAEINLMGGTYKLTSPVKIDSTNTCNKEVVYRAYSSEDVILTTSETLSLASATKVTDSALLDRLSDQSARDKIYSIDMSDYSGLLPKQALPGTYSGYIADLYKEFYNKRNQDPYPYYPDEKVTEPYPYGGTTTCAFYMNDEPMINSRYPNTGYFNSNPNVSTEFSRTTDGDGATPIYWEESMEAQYFVPASERNILDGFTLKYSNAIENRADKWTNANQAILFGYFMYDWASQSIPLANVDSVNNTITSKYPSYHGLFFKQVKPSLRFYIFDLFEEIDMAGEYFLDRTKGAEKLYFYSETDPTSKNITMVININDLMQITNAKNVTIDGLKFRDSGGYAIYGGAGSGSSNITIKNCDMKNLSGGAVYLKGTNNIIERCVIKNTNGGINIIGGNTATLERANNIVRNNEISNYAMITKTYIPGVEIAGVGNIVTHNEIYDNDHMAITFNGCYNEISYNDIHHVLKDTDDAGAIYTGMGWINRGNEVKYNYIHDIVNNNALLRNDTSVGVYFDDHYSGAYVFGNVFANIDGLGVFFNGGNGNTAQNNIFINCEKPFRLNKCRNSLEYYIGLGQTAEEAQQNYEHQYFTQINGLNNFVAAVVAAGAENIWAENFGDFWAKAQDSDNFKDTANIVYTDNVVVGCTEDAEFHAGVTGKVTKTPNYTAVSIDFVDYAGRNYQLKPSALAEFTTFTNIDFASIGIQE